MTTKACHLSQAEILEKLLIAYKEHEGIVYALKERKIVCLVRLGVINNYANIKSDLEQKMPEQACRVLARKMSPTGLKQIQIDLLDKEDGQSINMFREREERKKNILMVADDDMFVRKAMQKILGFYGDVVEVDSGDKVVSEYLRHNPDVLLLDIHMPGKSGLELIDKIIEVDTDAFIIVFSADSVADNVLQAIEKGAVGFVSKPPKKERIMDYLNRCITIH
ncbi:MAG TPA: response regulator [Alphaproteobacteria bacterium]|nr:response regulator [Alphaproteobacteria bacterium]USO05430.1 MAG: response regulator [Rhodospirillales bacterium]HOO81377.1 response regulator [Alphaproteobacteria bacterium]